jgi:multidrug efflux pump subunit AcrA (membrane-fusion protein)
MRLLLALALPLMLAACERAQSSTAAPSPFVATAVGRVDSEEEARQLVAAADGVIKHVDVSRGQTVTAGQALLSVDCGARPLRRNDALC